MNTLIRLCAAGALLGVAALFTGCVHDNTRTSRARVVEEFTVVESSTEKELTSAQLADLRLAVTNYLREQGLTDGRTYFVRVTFPSDNPEVDPQWAVVRISSHAARTYTVLAAYPGADDYYPFDFYRGSYSYANYYPGYYGFSRWGYYDPFDYNYGYYRPPAPPRDPVKPTEPSKPTDTNKPKDPNHPTAYPWGPRNRWENPPTRNDDQPRSNLPRRNPDDQRWSRGRPVVPDDPQSPPSRHDRNQTPPTRSYTPPPERSSPPAPERNYSPPPAYTPPPAPSYTPPPPSSDNSSRSTAASSVQQSREQER